MIEHVYIEKIKNGKAVNKDEKLDYINTLTFDSNQIVLNNNNFNMSQFLQDFNDIVIDTKNLYVYLDLQELINGEELSDQDYKNIYNQSIENIDYIFGNERIILHSSRLFKINKKNMILKTFLIYSEDEKSFAIYQKNQSEIKNKIALLSNVSKWDFRSLITAIHQMQLYKTLYKDLFSNNNKNRITNFIENAKNDKIYGVGLIKGNVKKDKRGNGEKYTVNSFKIEAEFLNYKGDFSITNKNIVFKLNIVTRVFVTKEKSATLSNIKTYNDKSVQMAILGQVDSISNYYDKKSISFNVHKFDDTKFHLYCLSIDMLKKNVFTHIVKGNLEQSFPILENEDFYKNNIQKQLIIGIVFEEHLKNKIEEYDFYFNAMLKNKSKWTNSDKVDIKHIQIEKNLEQEEVIKKLKESNCDCFICLTDIDDYNEDKEKHSDNIIVNDYYKIIKGYILKQNLENKQPLITQGLIVPNPELVDEDIEDDIIEEEDKKDKFKDKIKTAFYELCTKYIFYTNQIKLTSSFKENDYLIISFNAPSKLCSCIKIQAKDNNILILNKELLQLTSTNGNGFRKEENLINWLSKKIDNTDEVLKEISSYDDFIIYDLKEKNFLLCSSTQTYLLSDNQYALRKELILEHRTGKTYPKENKEGEIINKESTAIMSLLIPLYNVSKTMPSQIFLFEINNEQYYFVGNEMKKTQEHPQSPLVKMYFNENNPSLLDLYFSVITANVVRNGLNTKTTLFEKFSKLHMIN